MIITICMVNGTSAQKLLPAWIARLVGLSCASTPRMNTTTTPRSANTSGSGNHCSLQFASFKPKRTRRPSDTAVCVFCKVVLAGLGGARFRLKDELLHAPIQQFRHEHHVF